MRVVFLAAVSPAAGLGSVAFGVVMAARREEHCGGPGINKTPQNAGA